MFRHVPECSGMFHVPGSIDGRICDPPQAFDAKGESTLTTRLRCLRTRIWAY